MLRWIFGVFKILLLVCIVGFAVNAIFASTSDIKPFQSIINRVKWFKETVPEKNGNVNSNSGNKYENTDNQNNKPESEAENSQSEEESQNNVNPNNSDEYFMTFKEINSIDNIDTQDKLTGLAIMSKIKPDDLQEICKLAEGGITIDESKELKKILDRNLSKSQIEKLNELLIKNKKLFAEGKLTK